MSLENHKFAEAEAFTNVDGKMSGTGMRGAVALPWSKTSTRRKGLRRNLGDLASDRASLLAPVRIGKAKAKSQ